MPKVSQDYRDARRHQILEAATRCFLGNGFQATSMQGLFAASQLSSGAFYLYFKSKDDVILAIAEENMRMVTDLIDQLAENGSVEDGFGEALARTLESMESRNSHDRLATMAVLVWAEAVRSPGLRQRFADSVTRMRHELAVVVAAHQTTGALPSSVSADSLVKLLVAIVPGAILQLAMLGEDAMEGAAGAARVIWPR